MTCLCLKSKHSRYLHKRYNLHEKRIQILEVEIISKVVWTSAKCNWNAARCCVSQVVAQKWTLASVLLVNFTGCLMLSDYLVLNKIIMNVLVKCCLKI
jgi:hypothetical protein